MFPSSSQAQSTFDSCQGHYVNIIYFFHMANDGTVKEDRAGNELYTGCYPCVHGTVEQINLHPTATNTISEVLL